jgi:signal transduction histidine kinase
MYIYLFISAIFTGVTSIILGTLVYFGDTKNKINKLFGIMCLFLAIWSFGYFFPIVQDNKELSLLSFRLLHVGALFIAPSHFHFTCVFLGIGEQKKKFIIFGYLINLFFLFFIPTRFFIEDIVPKGNFVYWAEPGIAYHFWLALWMSYVAGFVYLFFSYIKKTTGIYKQQIKYLWIGSMITFGGGITNFLLFYDINIPPYANILAAAQSIILAYNIILQQFRKEVELRKELQEKNQKLESIIIQQSDFIAASTHELRTPLSIVDVYLKGLKKFLPKKTTAEQFYDTTCKAVQKLINLARRILDVQLHDRNRVELKLEKINTEKFLRSIYTEINKTATEKVITLQFKNKLKKKIEIEIDQTQISHVIRDLLANALKFVPKNGTGKIILQVEELDSDNIKISVIDNGCGVPKNTKQIIFEKFRSNHMSDGNGMGLGLYLCKKIIELHQGKIWHEDNHKGGSIFQIQLPKKLPFQKSSDLLSQTRPTVKFIPKLVD